jgi:hypothetical protein
MPDMKIYFLFDHLRPGIPPFKIELKTDEEAQRFLEENYLWATAGYSEDEVLYCTAGHVDKRPIASLTNKEKMRAWVAAQKKGEEVYIDIDEVVLLMGPLEYGEVIGEIHTTTPESILSRLTEAVNKIALTSMVYDETTQGLVGSLWTMFMQPPPDPQ